MATSDLTRLLRLFHLMERAFSQFLNAARLHNSIDPLLHEYLGREKRRTVTTLVSSDDVYAILPNDFLLFLEERVAAAEIQQIEKRLAGKRTDILSSLRASARADKQDDGASEKAWGDVLGVVAKELKEFRKTEHVLVDEPLLKDHPQGKTVNRTTVPRWAWRYTRSTIGDFVYKLEFLLNSRNTVMHGNDLKLASFEIVVETLADVFTSIRAWLGGSLSLIPDGHIFMMGPLEIVRFCEETGIEETPLFKVGSLDSFTFVGTSFNLVGGPDGAGSNSLAPAWPTSRLTDKVWVSKKPVRRDKFGEPQNGKPALDEAKWRKFCAELGEALNRDNSGQPKAKHHIRISRYKVDVVNSHPYAPLRWTETGEDELYVCFWQDRP